MGPYGTPTPGLRAHTVAQVRAAEDELMASLPAGVLMARAATGLAVGVAGWLEEHVGQVSGAKVLLVVGPGNNGGDALYAGAWLARRGAAVRWLATSDRVHEAGLAALEAAGGRRATPGDAAERADVALDAVLGIGGRPGLDDVAAAIFTALETHGVPVIAVDLPSGVDPDTGETPGRHVQAVATFTFGTHKVATLVDPAASACGVVRVVDIGLNTDSTQMTPAVTCYPGASGPRVRAPERADHKYTRGVVGVRAGSRTYPGAAMLAVSGANTGLVGMVRYVGPEAVRAEVTRQHPEVVGAGRVQAWTVGSGGAEEAENALAEALADGVAVLVDADALIHVCAHLTPGHGHRVLLTPHAGELATLLDVERSEVEARPLAHVRDAAARFGATVLLKGARTLVASPDGAVHVNTTGTPWLATAGAGDVLAGLGGALLASGLSPHDAGAGAAWLHGRAAEVAALDGPVRASDLPHALRRVVRDLIGTVGDSKHE